MDLSGETIVIILVGGLALGLLPGTFAERTGFRLVRDISFGIAAVAAATWLTFAWRNPAAVMADLPQSKQVESISEDAGPNYEPVVLPLASLRPLLKPVVYRSRKEICDSLVEAALRNDLPAHFFIRLLYQESSFRPAAISSAGALGVAQFMPETASDRKLDNPFDPLQAIPASARLLRDLYQKFGNLGLAAAAYNAGPKRVTDWRTNGGQLPQETQDYVKAITGYPAESWTAPQAGSPALKLPRMAPCQESVGLLAWDGPDQIPLPVAKPRPAELADQKNVTAQSALKKRQHRIGRAAEQSKHTKSANIARN
jgi:Transglycosylase SLT domain